MKFFIVVLAIFAVANAKLNIDVKALTSKVKSAINQNSLDSGEEIEEFFRTSFKEIAGEIELAVCKQNGTKVYDALHKSGECFKNVRFDGAMCDSFNAKFKECVKPVEAVFEGCVDDKFKGLTTLVVDSFTSTVSYLCDAKVKDVVELGNPCLNAMNEEKTNQCVKNLAEKAEDINKVTNVKQEVCSQVPEIVPCMMKEVKAVCQNEITRKAANDLLNAMFVQPCSKH